MVGHSWLSVILVGNGLTAMAGLEEPRNESVAIMTGPYVAAGATMPVGPAAALTLPEAGAALVMGAAAGDTSAGRPPTCEREPRVLARRRP